MSLKVEARINLNEVASTTKVIEQDDYNLKGTLLLAQENEHKKAEEDKTRMSEILMKIDVKSSLFRFYN